MVVLDASALIALIRDEPGAEVVNAKVDGAFISAVNLQEVVKELLDQGLSREAVKGILKAFNIRIEPHDREAAFEAAALAVLTRRYGRGLGDRSCMALAIKLGLPALTMDRAWAQLEIPGLQVILAR